MPCSVIVKHGRSRRRTPRECPSRSTKSAPPPATSARWPRCSGATPRRCSGCPGARPGASGPAGPCPVAGNPCASRPDCPPELAARLALVHVADADDGRAPARRMAGHPQARCAAGTGSSPAAKARPKRRGSRPRTASPSLRRNCLRAGREAPKPRRQPRSAEHCRRCSAP